MIRALSYIAISAIVLWAILMGVNSQTEGDLNLFARLLITGIYPFGTIMTIIFMPRQTPPQP